MRRLSGGWFALAVLLACVPCAAWGGWLQVQAGGVGETRSFVAAQGEDGITIRTTLSGIQVEEQSVAGALYEELTIAEGLETTDPGLPMIPYLLVKVALPDLAGVRVAAVEADYAPLDGAFRVLPVPEPTTDAAAETRYVPNADFYARDTWYPAQAVKLDKPAIWRDVRFVNVRVFPVRCNPGQGRLEAAKSVTVTLAYDGAAANLKQRRAFAPSGLMAAQYERSIVNYDAWKAGAPASKSRDMSTKYLIVTTDAFAPLVADFAQWQSDRGFPAEIKTLTEIGSSAAEIKAAITDYYNTTGLEFVLLVGDESHVPLPTSGGYPSDHYYGCVDGSDAYADVTYGRIPAADAADVTLQLNKILGYEQNAPGGAWVSNVILCAHEQDYPGKYTECKEQIRTFPYRLESPVFTTLYAAEGARAADVNAALNAGVGIVNYRGHGSEYSWSWAGGYDKGDIAGLTNSDRLPVVFSLACLNGSMDNTTECLGESWMKVTTGASGTLAATRASWTAENHVFDRAIFRAIFDEGVTLAGQAVIAGKNAMIDYSLSGDDNAYMYLWLGDPAMDIWTQLPATVSFSLPDAVPLHQDEVKVVLSTGGSPLPNGLAVLSKDPDVYASGYTDAWGVAFVEIAPASTGTVDVSVTAHNVLGAADSFEVVSEGCGNLHVDAAVYGNGSDVQISLWDADLDVDPGLADEASVLATSDAEPTGEVVLLSETGASTGKFTGSVPLSTTDGGPGVLLIADGDTITVTYDDVSCEGLPQVVSDTATADASPPVISSVAASGIDADEADIGFVTDEPGTTVVEYGETTSLGTVVQDLTLTTGHDAHLGGLSAETTYYYLVRSTDGWGNEAVDDNGGALYTFQTTTAGGCVVTELAVDDVRLAGLLPDLRRFRDEVLSSSPTGRSLIRAYYRHSPALIGFLDRHPVLEAGAREMVLRVGTWLTR